MYRKMPLFIILFLFSVSLILHASKTNYIVHEGFGTLSEGRFVKTALNSNGILYLSNSYDKFEIPDFEIVWDINFDANNDIYLFTGFDGIIKNETQNTEFQTELLAVVSTYRDDKGNLYCGGWIGGDIYKITKNEITKLTVLNDSYVWTIKSYDEDYLIIGTGPNGNIYKVNKETGENEVLISTELNHITAISLFQNKSVLFGSAQSSAVYQFIDDKIKVLNNFDGDEIVDIIVAEDKKSFIVAVNKGQHIFLTAESMQFFDDSHQRSGGNVRSSERTFNNRNNNEDSLFFDENTLNNRNNNENSLFFDESTLNNTNNDLNVNEENNFSYSEGETQQQQPTETRSMQRRPPQPRLSDVSGIIYRYNVSGKITEVYSTNNGYINSIEVIDDNKVIVAVGNQRKLVKIDLNTLLVSDFIITESRDFIKVKKFDVAQKIFAVTKKPVSLYSINKSMANQGEYISNIIDFGFNAKAGLSQITPSPSAGNLKMYFRNGNVNIPNQYWSEWTDNVLKLNFARFFQYKIVMYKDRFVDISPEIRKITIPYIKVNRAPVIKDFSINKSANSNGRRSPGSGQNRPSQQSSSSNVKDHNIHLAWEVIDPDRDELLYKLYYKNLETDLWVEITENWIKENSYTLNTNHFKNGYYVFKLKVSDILSNTVENHSVRRRKSDVFLIDNSSPEITVERFIVDNHTLYLYALLHAEHSIIKEQHFKINHREWRFFPPEDLINDSKKEKIKLTLTSNDGLVKGVNTISIKFSDFSGNTTYWTEDFVVE